MANVWRMNRIFVLTGATWLSTLSFLAPNISMSQTNQTDAHRWLEKVQLAPPFTVAKSKAAWESQRKQVRAQLGELLGKLPPRPDSFASKPAQVLMLAT